MADKIDAFDIAALERSVNDSATRVSAIWLSFVAFSAYLAAAASNVSHRQIFLEEPIKLPTIDIDLPLVASAILLPLLFVIYHVYVLLQVVLLARTADAYNEALDHGSPREPTARACASGLPIPCSRSCSPARRASAQACSAPCCVSWRGSRSRSHRRWC